MRVPVRSYPDVSGSGELFQFAMAFLAVKGPGLAVPGGAMQTNIGHTGLIATGGSTFGRAFSLDCQNFRWCGGLGGLSMLSGVREGARDRCRGTGIVTHQTHLFGGPLYFCAGKFVRWDKMPRERTRGG